ncbi:MAG: hypothetical protein WAM85_21965 [Terracidiphilus sp.]
MRTRKLVFLAIVGVIGFGAGCRSNHVDKGAFKTALDSYLSGKPDCLWSAPIKFPAQASASDEDQTKGFDALTDAGMLTRKPVEKERFLIGSKQMNDYDLSDTGRSRWIADPSQPGYGNFCFGHFQVNSIDGFTHIANTNGAQYSVTYHYSVTGMPGWANTAEMKTAFPKVGADSSSQETATATLLKSDDGWQVQNVQPATTGQ